MKNLRFVIYKKSVWKKKVEGEGGGRERVRKLNIAKRAGLISLEHFRNYAR